RRRGGGGGLDAPAQELPLQPLVAGHLRARAVRLRLLGRRQPAGRRAVQECADGVPARGGGLPGGDRPAQRLPDPGAVLRGLPAARVAAGDRDGRASARGAAAVAGGLGLAQAGPRGGAGGRLGGAASARREGMVTRMASDEAPQNVYDDPRFFAGYAQMERFGAGWDLAVEQPSFLGLLPDVAGRRALDLGCGVGQLALYLAEARAAEGVALDGPERLPELARPQRARPRVEYRLQPIEGAEFPPERFDLVVSSLAFHYVADYDGLVRSVAGWLAPRGLLVFSTEHPIYTARLPGEGWVLGGDGQRVGW